MYRYTLYNIFISHYFETIALSCKISCGLVYLKLIILLHNLFVLNRFI